MKHVVLVLGLGVLLGSCSGAEIREEQASSTQATPATPATTTVEIRDASPLGGALYDKWWLVARLPEPEGDHPLWAKRPDQASNKRRGKSTFRCKECHGWDYRGVDGAYGSGSHRTGFPGILRAKTKSAAELGALIKDGHGYGGLGLADKHIEALVAFVQRGTLDMTQLIDEKKAFKALPSSGQALFEGKIGTNLACASCHGKDGLKAPKGYPDFDDFPGKLSRKNPWELVHKIRFGQPGTKMPRASTLGHAEIRALGAYIQTLGR